MKLYCFNGASSLAVRILINELGLPCKFELVNLATKETHTGENFLNINPKGYVPVLEIESGIILTECSTILQYLADRHNATSLLPPINDFDRYRVLEWANFISTELQKGIAPLIATHFNSLVPKLVDSAMFFIRLKSRLRFLDQHLQNNKYLVGNNFTIADMYLFILFPCLPLANISLAEYQHLHRYFLELKKRKSIEQSIQQEGLALDSLN